MTENEHSSFFRSALPGREAASLLALQRQLEQTQWWPAAELERHQFRQLANSLRQAYENVPFHHRRLTAAGYDSGMNLTQEVFHTLPQMTCGDIQVRGAPSWHAACPRSTAG